MTELDAHETEFRNDIWADVNVLQWWLTLVLGRLIYSRQNSEIGCDVFLLGPHTPVYGNHTV